jgi:mannose-6-phosphate isomerase-like protein (cupin superfamily)
MRQADPEETVKSSTEQITMSTSRAAYAHAIDNEFNGEWLQARPGERFSIRIPSLATNCRYSVIEILSSPGDSTPIHLHEREDEHVLVVEGTARVLYGDKTFDATAGTVVSLARGIPHAWGNPTGTPLRLVITATPGGVEESLRLIANKRRSSKPGGACRQLWNSAYWPPAIG